MATISNLTIVNDIALIQPGQAISCEYTAGAGSFGTFADLGKAVKPLIDVSVNKGAIDGSFYFICVGYTPAEKPKLIADRNIQASVSWEAINTAGLCTTSGKTITIDDNSTNLSMRLLGSSSDANGEYDAILVNYNLGGKTATGDSEFWNSTIPSWTTLSSATAANRIQRGGTTIDARTDVDSSTATATCGFRPVLIYDAQPGAFTRGNPGTPLQIITDLALIEPGQAISCEYTATAGVFGSFANIGKATKPMLSDLAPAAPDGTFYFICVGYAPNGRKKLVADRNIQGNISWETLNTAGLCTSSGISCAIDSLAYPMSLRIPQTTPYRHTSPADTTTYGEWDYIVSQSNLTGKITASDNDVWNAASTFSWTLATLSTVDDAGTAADPSMRIVRGAQDEGYSNISQGKSMSSNAAATVGFRPVLTVLTSGEAGDTSFPENSLTLVTNPFKCLPGQAVSCEYTATTAGALGTFSNLGKATKKVIPDPCGQKPDGTFYFICVGYTPSGALKFVADRNIQGSISWETLSAAGYGTTSGTDVSEITGFTGSYMRLLSSARCNKTQMTSGSEWDVLLMNSSGCIGKSSVSNADKFNYTKARSWTIDTPSMNDDVGTTAAAATRVCRGYEASDYSTTQKYIFDSSATFERVCFRPVLIIPTDKSSINADITITPINIKDQDAVMDCSFTLLMSDTLPADSVMTTKINDIVIGEIEPIASTTFQKTFANSLFSAGINILKTILKVDGIDNIYSFTITKEHVLDTSRCRDILSYAGGFNLADTAIVNNKVVNQKSIKAEIKPVSAAVPVMVKVPSKVISVKLT